MRTESSNTRFNAEALRTRSGAATFFGLRWQSEAATPLLGGVVPFPKRRGASLPAAVQSFASLHLCAFALILLPLCLSAATNDLTGALQRGLFEEEANRNLDAAAQAYQAVSAQFDKDRKLAATAIFRLGEVYRKQGRTNEAVAQYERIVREFAEEQTLVTLSRQNLAGLVTRTGATASPSLTRAARAEQKRLLEQEIKLVEQDLAELKKLSEMGKGSQAEVRAKEREVLQLRQQLAALAEDGTESPASPRLTLAARLEQKQLLEQEINVAQKDLAEVTKQADVGTASPTDVRAKEREVLKLRQQLAALSDERSAEPVQEAAAPASAVATAEREAESLDTTLQKLKQLPRQPLRDAVQQNFPNPVLTDLIKQLTQAEQNLAVLNRDYAPGHPEVIRAKTLADTIQKQIADQVDGIMKGLEIKLDAAHETAKKLRGQLEASRSAPTTSSSLSTAATAATDDEEKEIRRIQEMIKNSPDLINAPVASENGHLTPLCRAAGAGWLRVAKFLLDGSAAIDRRSVNSTPLHYAVNAGHRAMTDFLLERGADVNARDGGGRTPLHIAAENGFQAVAEVLVAHKADINPITSKGETPLHLAARRGHAELVKYLISIGTKLDAKDESGQTALLWAADRGHSESVTAMLAAKANPNLEDNKGRTPLSYAAEAGHLDSVKALLAAKGDPNGGSLSLPLHAAIHRKSPAIVEALLRADANPNTVAAISWAFSSGAPPFVQSYGFGWQYANLTPLFIAIAEANSPESVELLLQFKADPNGLNPEGWPLIFSAVDKSEILKLLLEAGAKPNAEIKSSPGWTPIYTAKSAESTKLLLAHGANAEVRVEDKTPLLRAVDDRNKGKIEALLQGGAEVNARDNFDHTPLHLAVLYGNSEIISLLLAHKADVNARDKNGQTPLDYVKANTQKANIAELLRRHGGLSDLPKSDHIVVTRPGTDISTTIFLKGTNDWNRFTLMDALYGKYGTGITPASTVTPSGLTASFSDRIRALTVAVDMPFPDLHRIVVVRSGDSPNKPPKRINVDLLLPTGVVDCAKDIPLEFGDVVEIPEREHTLQEPAVGLTSEELQQIGKCREGTVVLIVRAKRTELQVAPSKGSAMIGSVLMRPEVRSALFSSSDLSQIKLTRRGAESEKQREWIVDCSGGKTPDLWLRDGDVIEVPDKP